MKLSCNIVEDLLPSYIEHLTSDNTNIEIQEHLSGCISCTALYADMKEEMKIPKKENYVENKTNLGYLNKIWNYHDKKSVFSLVMFMCMTAFTLLIVWNTFGNIQNSIQISYGILPLIIVVGGVLCYKNSIRSFGKGYDLWIGHGLLIFAALMIVLIIYSSYIWVIEEHYPFGLQAYELGPFVTRFLNAGSGIGIVLFFYGAYSIIHKSYTYYFLCAHAISLICMGIGYYRILRTLSDVRVYVQLCIQIGLIYVLGIGVTVIVWIILKQLSLKKMQ